MDQKTYIEIEGTQELEYHLPNELDKFDGPIRHRKEITGTDRQGKARLMSIVGIMPTVVHGWANGEIHTLIIYEWKTVPGHQGLRFKDLIIEVSFVANGPRGAAEDEARDMRSRGFKSNVSDPEVVSAVPSAVQLYNVTKHKIGGNNTGEFGFSAGFAPYFSAEAKYIMERNSAVSITDAVQVAGQPYVVGSGRSRLNAIRWTILENDSQRPGIPAYLRTAVLLKRQSDDDGLFLGHVKIKSHVSWWEDIMETKGKVFGDIKPDDPIIFDPKEPTSSVFDHQKAKLDLVDLDAQFRMVCLATLQTTKSENIGEDNEERLTETSGEN
ncbi:uncharacterized protein Triagg1_2149 [Trichoderma aggressivum f. europaeum]|uniref:Uncharacterized protein n=1 Tax=Trichoderma aggressivum f. europaeum TaxID=173218 RepID=A0AAE1M1Z6_9HYPO|nr:hypothetical protein Triagg1_2149 [Trichoderma aggressivum f. europaeum]